MTNSPEIFRDYNGSYVSDISSFVSNWMQSHQNGEIYVGCDSKVRGSQVKYSTVICMWDKGHGVSEIYKNELAKKPKDTYTRLWNEVTKALEVAQNLKQIAEITVHVDLNSDPKYRSNRLYDASIGLLNSYGFEAAGKPHSWAASCGAHRHCQ